MSALPTPKEVYWCLLPACPTCGLGVRASTMLRAWLARPDVTIEPEAMIVTSAGPGTLSNTRKPLADHLRALTREERYQAGRKLDAFFAELERRQLDGARATRTVAWRCRTM